MRPIKTLAVCIAVLCACVEFQTQPRDAGGGDVPVFDTTTGDVSNGDASAPDSSVDVPVASDVMSVDGSPLSDVIVADVSPSDVVAADVPGQSDAIAVDIPGQSDVLTVDVPILSDVPLADAQTDAPDATTPTPTFRGSVGSVGVFATPTLRVVGVLEPLTRFCNADRSLCISGGISP